MPAIVSHRGGLCVHAENSIEAFVWSAQQGFDEIEFDLHMTSDGGLVVFHDLVLQHTSHGFGEISQRTLAELKATSLRGTTETIPSFDDLLRAIASYPIGLRVELKRSRTKRPYANIFEPVVAALDRHGLRKRAVISSFEPEALVQFAESGFPTAIWYDRIQRPDQIELIEWLPQLARQGVRDIAIHVNEYTAERYRAASGAGFRLGIWTVNGQSRLDYWLRQPLDFLVTDQPDLAQSLRSKLAQKGE